MNTSSSISLIHVAALAFALPTMAQTPAETILPAIPLSGQTRVKADAAHAAATHAGVVVNPNPTKAAITTPHATVFSENSSPSRDQTVAYYLPVGAISPQSGIRTYPGSTAAHITNGATRASNGIPAGSTVARRAGSAGKSSTKARTVNTR